jgi:hypothetical protein
MGDEKDNAPDEKAGEVVSMFEHEARKEAGVRIAGTVDRLREVAEKHSIPIGSSIELKDPLTGDTKLYQPVWFGCVHCLWEREQDQERDPFEPSAGESVYRFYDEEGDDRYLCGECGSKVMPLDRKVEMFVDASVLRGDGLQVAMPIRLGYKAPGRPRPREMRAQLHRWWVSSMQAMGIDNGLVPPKGRSDVRDLDSPGSGMGGPPTHKDYEGIDPPELTPEMLGEFHSSLSDKLGIEIDAPDEDE